MRLALLFLDGVGIGRKNPDINPFFCARMPVFASLCGGTIPHRPFSRVSYNATEIVSINATLGVAGFPQSGTGQTALFTGVNGAKKFGRHFGPHPPLILHPIIAARNIFQQLKSLGKSVIFANAFPQRFFDYNSTVNKRLTVTTLSCKLSGVPLLTAYELQRNEAISADFTREHWPELGHPNISPITPHEAGKHLWSIVTQHDFTLFEYWLPDHAGHSREMTYAIKVLEHFDEFLAGFLELFDSTNTILIIVSDHGNIENLSTKSHTRNRVPCILTGIHCRQLADRITSLLHITPAIISLFTDS